MPVTLYSNQDNSAPGLTRIVGSMIALLDAVLVNGYGTKPGAGWTKAFVGTNVAVYRNNSLAVGSTGMYLHVDDSNVSYSRVKVYKTMVDINNGSDLIPGGIPTYANANIYWHKNYNSADTVEHPWAIAADDRTFYLNIAPNGTEPATINSYTYIYGAGDFETFVPGNSYNYFLIGSPNTNGADWSTQVTNDQGGNGCALIGRSQELAQNKCSKFWVAPFGLTNANAWSGSTAHMAYSSYTGLRFFYPAFMVEESTQTGITGKLRGVHAYAGRSTGNWIENFGKLPDDPAGPDMIQFLSYNQSLYVRLGNW